MLKVFITTTDSITENSIQELSKEQIDKASKYKIKEDKIRSITSSLLLNYVLKRYNLINFRIVKNQFGKPYLENNEIYFNLSHSGKYVICAVSDKEIGADIQIIKDANELVMEKCYSNDEREFVSSKEDFIKVWTLKESYIKKQGIGLGIKLDTFTTIKNNEIYQTDKFRYLNLQIENYMLSICYEGSSKVSFEYIRL